MGSIPGKEEEIILTTNNLPLKKDLPKIQPSAQKCENFLLEMWDQMYTPAWVKTPFISICNSYMLDFKEDGCMYKIKLKIKKIM